MPNIYLSNSKYLTSSSVAQYIDPVTLLAPRNITREIEYDRSTCMVSFANGNGPLQPSKTTGEELFAKVPPLELEMCLNKVRELEHKVDRASNAAKKNIASIGCVDTGATAKIAALLRLVAEELRRNPHEYPNLVASHNTPEDRLWLADQIISKALE